MASRRPVLALHTYRPTGGVGGVQDTCSSDPAIADSEPSAAAVTLRAADTSGTSVDVNVPADTAARQSTATDDRVGQAFRSRKDRGGQAFKSRQVGQPSDHGKTESDRPSDHRKSVRPSDHGKLVMPSDHRKSVRP